MSLFPVERVAYITGAGSGIGRAITLQFAADGLRNIALVSRSKAGLVETAKLLTESHPDIKLFVTLADVSKEEDVKRCVEETVKKSGRIDHCVNAAGIGGVFVATGDLGAQQLDDVLGVNLRGVWLWEREEIRQLLKQEMRAVSTGLELQTRRSIVNVSSIMGHVGMANIGPYVIAKHGLLGLTKTDAIQYADQGIRVNAISAGLVRTPILSEEEWDATMPLIETKPMKRFALPEEIAYAVCFLSSDRSSFTTGSSMVVNGGWTTE